MSYRVPARVGHVVREAASGDQSDSVYLMRLPDGEPLLLEGTAALIWLLAADGDDNVEQTVASVLLDAPADTVGITRDYLSQLVAQGLLEKRSPDHVDDTRGPDEMR